MDPDAVAFLSRRLRNTSSDTPLMDVLSEHSQRMRRIHSNVYTSKFYDTFNSVAGKVHLNKLLSQENGYAEYIIRTYYDMFADSRPTIIKDVAKIMSSFGQ